MPSPNTPQDLIDRISKLERLVRDLSGRMNIRPALNTIVGGSVSVKGGGQLIVEDSDGTGLFRVGQQNPDLDGATQQGVVMRRMDGSLAFAIWNSEGTGLQPVRIFDKGGWIVFADDIANGGLANPWVPLPLPQPVGITHPNWVSAASGSAFTVGHSALAFLQHPYLYANVGYLFTGTAVGEIKVVINGEDAFVASGEPIDDVFPVPSWEWQGVPIPATVQIQGRIVSGTGTLKFAPFSMVGRQSPAT
jgi:hypothetical protein